MSDHRDIKPDSNAKENTSLSEKDYVHLTEAQQQPVSIKAWSQKILVALLCVASFYGGWKSYESNMVKECTANGGQMVEAQRTMLCQLP